MEVPSLSGSVFDAGDGHRRWVGLLWNPAELRHHALQYLFVGSRAVVNLDALQAHYELRKLSGIGWGLAFDPVVPRRGKANPEVHAKLAQQVSNLPLREPARSLGKAPSSRLKSLPAV